MLATLPFAVGRLVALGAGSAIGEHDGRAGRAPAAEQSEREPGAGAQQQQAEEGSECIHGRRRLAGGGLKGSELMAFEVERPHGTALQA